MSGPSVHLRWPPSWLFHIPPAPDPLTLPPPEDQRTFAAPFGIDHRFYNGALDWKVPITIASIYAVTVILLNQHNRSHGNKPWAISKTRLFYRFVIVHNVFLAVFSLLTCWAMLRSLAHAWPGKREILFLGKYWPGLRTQNGLAGAADALCKMHGPRGFGDAAYYNVNATAWENKNKLVLPAANGNPDPTDVGRLWNEGLAFWGFWFYLSKFYEVLDTFIILAKGKKSSTLQTYHHTGAMLCMWAGIRFMSPPIWMFVFINSAIHAMMYTYYTLSALGFKVPQSFKKTLTTMQIMQFVIGFTFALGHLFVEYTVPVSTPYTVSSTFTSFISSPSAAISSVVTSATAATASTPIASWLKKLAFRAAGEGGLAENVLNDQGKPFGLDSNDIIETVEREVRYRTQYETVACIDTQGQAFAVYLNLIYLAPLTWLFVRFFVRSYSRHIDTKIRHQTKSGKLNKMTEDAAHSVNRELDQFGKTAEAVVGDSLENLKRTASGDGNEKLETPKSADKRRVSATIERQFKRFEEGKQSAEEAVNDTVDKMKSNGSAGAGRLRKKASEGHEKLRSMWEEGMDGRSPTESAYEVAIKAKDAALDGMQGTKATVVGQVDDAMSKLEKSAEEAVQKAKQAVSSATKDAGEKFEKEMEGDISLESEARETKSVMQEPEGRAKEATRKDSATEQDGLEVGDQRYKSSASDKDENRRPAELRAGESKGTDASWEDLHASELKQQKGDYRKEDEAQSERSESPGLSRTQSRDSTHKVQTHSKIPRPKDSSRSRSPVKKAATTNRSATPKTNSRASPVKEEKEISHDGATDDPHRLEGTADSEPTLAQVSKKGEMAGANTKEVAQKNEDVHEEESK